MRASSIITIVAVVLAGCATPEPATPTTEPHERTVLTVAPEARSPHEVQVARNVMAILRGMRHAELERLAEVTPCKEGDTDCE